MCLYSQQEICLKIQLILYLQLSWKNKVKYLNIPKFLGVFQKDIDLCMLIFLFPCLRLEVEGPDHAEDEDDTDDGEEGDHGDEERALLLTALISLRSRWGEQEEQLRGGYYLYMFSSFGGDLTEGNRWNNEGESSTVSILSYSFQIVFTEGGNEEAFINYCLLIHNSIHWVGKGGDHFAAL